MNDLLTIALSTAEGDAASTGSGILSFALLPLMLLAMYFLIIRPNSKKRKEVQSLQSTLGVGDEVMTTGGIIGTITGEDGPTRFWLEIDDDVQVRIARGGIQGRISDEGAASDTVDESDESNEADDASEATESADND